MNNTTESNTTTSSGPPSVYITSLHAIYISHAVFLIVGTYLNSWVFLSIVTSEKLRGRLRNQLICNMAVVHLTESLIKSPVIIVFILKILAKDFDGNSCHLVATISNTERIQSFIVDWLLVILSITYLAQVLDWDPTHTLTHLSLRIGKLILHILPWITALVVTPSLVYFYSGKGACLSAPYLSHYVFTAINTLTPIFLSIFFTTMACVLGSFKRRSSNLGAHLVDGDRRVDNSMAYIVAVVTTITCEVCNVAFYMYLKVNKKFLGVAFESAALILSDSRVIVMVLPWLLFADLWERIKTWRPWYRPAPGIDLSVAYGKDGD